jgi:hypothetical protein
LLRPPLLPDFVGVRHDTQVCTPLYVAVSCHHRSPDLTRRRVPTQGVVALALSSGDTRLAVHHGGGVDVHHVAAFMQRQPPQHRLCVGQPPRLLSWYVPCFSLSQHRSPHRSLSYLVDHRIHLVAQAAGTSRRVPDAVPGWRAEHTHARRGWCPGEPPSQRGCPFGRHRRVLEPGRWVHRLCPHGGDPVDC